MVEAFAMIAGTALEYGDRTLACLDEVQTEAKSSRLAFAFRFSGWSRNSRAAVSHTEVGD